MIRKLANQMKLSRQIKALEQIKTLDEKKRYLDAIWEDVGNHSLLDFYVKIMPMLTDAERCSIFIHDPKRQAVWLKAGTGEEEKQIELSLDDDSIVSNVITSGEPTIINGLNEAEGDSQVTDGESGFVTKSIMCIPVRSLDGSEITGAIQLQNKKDDQLFSDDDLSLLTEVAQYLEWSLENISYHAEATDILENMQPVIMTIVILIGVVVTLSLLLAGYWALLS